MGTITGFGFQNSSSVSAVKATHVVVFSNETFDSVGPISVIYTANSNIPYPNSSDFPGTPTPSFILFYSGNGSYTQNQVISAGSIDTSTLVTTKIIGVASSSTAAGRAANFKSAIEFATSGAMTCALSTTSVTNDTLTITQNVAGESGNTNVTENFLGYASIDSITSSFPSAFTGGAETTTSFDFYTMTVETSNLYDLPTTNDYIFFSQDNAINLSSLVGYFAEAKIRNNSTEFAEMFSLSAGVVESSK
tara:strand:- start:139 stop:885 length:747 start_codon:yes stop_codon:yes gene_type:complete